MKDAIAKDIKVDGASDSRMVSRPHRPVPDKCYAIVKKPEYRDPRGYILSANRRLHRPTKFVNIMIKSGLTAHRATAPFTVAGKQYPAGSYVFKGAQRSARTCSTCSSRRIIRTTSSIPAARRFRLRQRRLDARVPDGPEVRSRPRRVRWSVREDPDVIKPAPGKVTDAAGAVGYVVNHRNNDAFIAVNRLLKANEEALFVGDRSYQSADGTGVIFITAKPTTKAILDKAAIDLGLNFGRHRASRGRDV